MHEEILILSMHVVLVLFCYILLFGLGYLLTIHSTITSAGAVAAAVATAVATPTMLFSIVTCFSHALSRVLVGKSLIKGWTNVENNKRNYQPISDEVFDTILAPGLRRGGLTAWVYFYNYGKSGKLSCLFDLLSCIPK